jgi:hypothetical protein
MRLFTALRIGYLAASVSIAGFCLSAQTKEALGLPPRATPGDYQAQGKAGPVTIGAEFAGHSAPTLEGTYGTEDYVVVEVGLFGPANTPVKVSFEDFSLRVNGKKGALPAQSAESAFRSLKDPDWEPPASASKPSSGISTGGGSGGGGGEAPAPPRMPMDLRLKMEQRVRKASLLSGERALPQAGLIFFSYHGKVEGIHSLDLIYSGPAGTAVLALQP